MSETTANYVIVTLDNLDIEFGSVLHDPAPVLTYHQPLRPENAGPEYDEEIYGNVILQPQPLVQCDVKLKIKTGDIFRVVGPVKWPTIEDGQLVTHADTLQPNEIWDELAHMYLGNSMVAWCDADGNVDRARTDASRVAFWLENATKGFPAHFPGVAAPGLLARVANEAKEHGAIQRSTGSSAKIKGEPVVLQMTLRTPDRQAGIAWGGDTLHLSAKHILHKGNDTEPPTEFTEELTLEVLLNYADGAFEMGFNGHTLSISLADIGLDLPDMDAVGAALNDRDRARAHINSTPDDPRPAGGDDADAQTSLPFGDAPQSCGELVTANEVKSRKGSRLLVKQDIQFRFPTAQPVQQAITIFTRGKWTESEGGDSVIGSHNGAQLLYECDSEIDLTPQRAIHILAKRGPSVVQTFLGLTGFWLQQCGGKPYDHTVHATVTDLLRYMKRKPTTGGGYRFDDISERGRDVHILMKTSMPSAEITTYKGKNATRTRVEIERLVQIDSVAVTKVSDAGGVAITGEFSYHLGQKMHAWLCGDHPQYATISSKILEYHPVREKYHILLGFALSYYDRVNRQKRGGRTRSISLIKLLEMAGIDIPDRNIPRWLADIQGAISDLAADGVIPNVTSSVPLTSQVTGRQALAKSEVSFPPLLSNDQPILLLN